MRVAVSGFTVLIDEEDYFRIKTEWPYWKVNKHNGYVYVGKYLNRYVVTKNGKKRPDYKWAFLHRHVARTPPGMVTDHANGNPLDNRRANLRVCSQGENVANRRRSSRNGGGTSIYKGVWHDGRYWVVQIRKNRKILFNKSFRTESEAVAAQKEMSVKIHGKFAWKEPA